MSDIALAARYRRLRDNHDDIARAVAGICDRHGFKDWIELMESNPDMFEALVTEFESIVEQLPEVP